MPCSTVKVNWRFGGIYRLHVQCQRVSQARNKHEADRELHLLSQRMEHFTATTVRNSDHKKICFVPRLSDQCSYRNRPIRPTNRNDYLIPLQEQSRIVSRIASGCAVEPVRRLIESSGVTLGQTVRVLQPQFPDSGTANTLMWSQFPCVYKNVFE
jgi:hypothetical protein